MPGSSSDAYQWTSQAPEGERSHLRLESDYYREDDYVTRSVCVASVPLPTSFIDSNDFFIEPDDFLDDVGMVKGGAFGNDLNSKANALSGGLRSLRNGFNASPPEIASSEMPLGGYSLESCKKFAATEQAPCLPRNKFFQLSEATLRLSCTSHSGLMNDLLDFLGTQVSSSVTKVNCQKFTIKADVFINGLMCGIKVRCYHDEQQSNFEMSHLALEFQRRRGDCIAFSKVLKLAARYLEYQVISIENVLDDAKVCFPSAPSCTIDTAADKDLSPLLDMASAIGAPELQAESAACLAEMSEDPELAALLCTEKSIASIKMLLDRCRIDIDYPTARILRNIATRVEAAAFFTDEELIGVITEKMSSTDTVHLVQQELAAAMDIAASVAHR